MGVLFVISLDESLHLLKGLLLLIDNMCIIGEYETTILSEYQRFSYPHAYRIS